MFGIDRETLEANAKRWHYTEIAELITAAEDRFNDVAAKSAEKDYQALLTDFFGKAVLYTKEILTILYNGYADGAMSLAGELFEASVTLTFIEKNKSDSGIAERYFDDIELCSVTDSTRLLSFLKEGASDSQTSVGLSDMISRKKRTYEALKTKHSAFLPDGLFRPYWWVGTLLDAKEKNFSGILRNTAWDKTIFKHIYNMSKHGGHNAVNPAEDSDAAAILTNPSTEGFQIPLCFTLTSFSNIAKIVFANDEIDFSDIDDRLTKITKPMFAEIWK